MDNLVLALIAVNVFGILAFAIYVFIFALIIICLIRVARYFRDAGKEQKLIRMELGKVAEEVHMLRKGMKDSKVSKSPDKSV
jgi:hypothetical protein